MNDQGLAGIGDASLQEHAGDTKVAPAHGIAAIALSLAMKYHDIATVQDGALYQQYKLEGKNFETLTLAGVFETAIQIENHLLGASERIAKVVVEAITLMPEEAEGDDAEDAKPSNERGEANP